MEGGYFNSIFQCSAYPEFLHALGRVTGGAQLPQSLLADVQQALAPCPDAGRDPTASQLGDPYSQDRRQQLERRLRTVRECAGMLQDLSWEKLHSGPWKAVELVWRDLYTVASLLLAMCHRATGYGTLTAVTPTAPDMTLAPPRSKSHLVPADGPADALIKATALPDPNIRSTGAAGEDTVVGEHAHPSSATGKGLSTADSGGRQMSADASEPRGETTCAAAVAHAPGEGSTVVDGSRDVPGILHVTPAPSSTTGSRHIIPGHHFSTSLSPAPSLEPSSVTPSARAHSSLTPSSLPQSPIQQSSLKPASPLEQPSRKQSTLEQSLRLLDMAVMMGGPTFRHLADAEIAICQGALQGEHNPMPSGLAPAPAGSNRDRTCTGGHGGAAGARAGGVSLAPSGMAGNKGRQDPIAWDLDARTQTFPGGKAGVSTDTLQHLGTAGTAVAADGGSRFLDGWRPGSGSEEGGLQEKKEDLPGLEEEGLREAPAAIVAREEPLGFAKLGHAAKKQKCLERDGQSHDLILGAEGVAQGASPAGQWVVSVDLDQVLLSRLPPGSCLYLQGPPAVGAGSMGREVEGLAGREREAEGQDGMARRRVEECVAVVGGSREDGREAAEQGAEGGGKYLLKDKKDFVLTFTKPQTGRGETHDGSSGIYDGPSRRHEGPSRMQDDPSRNGPSRMEDGLSRNGPSRMQDDPSRNGPSRMEDDLSRMQQEMRDDYGDVCGGGVCVAVPRVSLPSLERFYCDHMVAGVPAVVTDAMSLWPAMQRWPDLGYLCHVAGPRTVPVEVGETYLAQGWGQQLMTLREFIETHVLAEPEQGAPYDMTPRSDMTGWPGPQPPNETPSGLMPLETKPHDGEPWGLNGEVDTETPLLAAPEVGRHGFVSSGLKSSGFKSSGLMPPEPQWRGKADARPRRPRGYLAQHPLFEQIPALRRDILTPDYCSLGDPGELRATNAWFGPAATVTPLHTDPHHNLLAQVVGCKYVRLYAPSCGASMYPFEETMLCNSSQVDLDRVDKERFPLFKQAPYWDCILKPGEMLYIPPLWWHYVKSLSVSFSVSFWWQ
eukprot:jgi/Mesvir1/5956/Mv00713-RA.1